MIVIKQCYKCQRNGHEGLGGTSICSCKWLLENLKLSYELRTLRKYSPSLQPAVDCNVKQLVMGLIKINTVIYIGEIGCSMMSR
jgi:hypothetical protein